jgi:tRNA-binding protein
MTGASDDPTPVFIIDDIPGMVELMKLWVERSGDFSVAGVAEDAEAGKRLVCRSEHRRGIVLMDVRIPNSDSFAAAREIRSAKPDLMLVFISGACHDNDIARAVALGARGYLMKTQRRDGFLRSLRSIAAGETSFDEQVQERFALDPDGRPLASLETRLATLTPREQEVLRYVASGLSKKEVAAKLSLSVKTIEHHTSSLMEKLGIHDRVELSRYAVREGLIEDLPPYTPEEDHTGPLSMEEFQRVELRVGRILSAEVFPEARKPAYVLQVDFGPELGTLKSSAQITVHYSCEELVGRLVVGVVNFPPRQIGPILSQCLVTGFEDGDGGVRLCVPDGDVPPGTRLS